MDRYEKMAKVCEIAEMKCTIQEWVKAELDQGKEHVDTKEMGEAIDMIKDLAETEKLCYESMYYESVINAMEDAKDEDPRYYHKRMNKPYARYPDDIMYRPMVDQEPYIDAYLDDRMGYSRGGNSYGRSSMSGRSSGSIGGGRSGGRSGYSPEDDWDRMNDNSRYGQAYNDYRVLRKHYTETGSKADKDEMSMKAQEHLADTMMTVRDIWKNADPDMKTKMKKDFQGLMSEMNM